MSDERIEDMIEQLFPNFISSLEDRLQGPLPGWEAQVQLTSQAPAIRGIKPRPDHRKGGVLALLYPVDDRPHIVLMQRTQDGKVHGGQVSFPGGKVEPTDTDEIAAALRESEEELGIPQHEVQLLGQLTPLYVPASNFLVYPTVGYLDYRPDFVPSEFEVAKVIETSLNHLHDPSTLQTVKIRVRKDWTLHAPAFVVEESIIWGATAMMLNELLVLTKENFQAGA